MSELGRFQPLRHAPAPIHQTLNLGVAMQYQETSQWCWVAVATSINHFYNPASTETQCELMTIVGQTVNELSLSTGACPDPSMVAANPTLASQLANPYNSNALYCLEGQITPAYLKSGGVGDALNVHDNWNSPSLPRLSLSQIAAEIDNGRPVVVDITWQSGAQHFVAIVGVVNEMLVICDPINGQSSLQYSAFPSQYFGGATLDQVYLTRPAYSPSSAKWSPEQQGVGVGTSNAPALAEFNGRLYAAWKGVPGDTRMFWSSFDGRNWSPEQPGVGVGSSNGPSLAVFNGKLYAAWKGVPGDTRMFWSSFDGHSWSPEQPGVGVGTSDGPSLAVFNGKLYAAWKGVPGDTRMFWSSFDGTSWSPEQQGVGFGTSTGPALAAFNGKLYAAWKGEPGDGRMFWSSLDGGGWSSEQKLSAAVGTSARPTLAVFNGQLYAAWKSVPNDNRMLLSVFDGTSTWSLARRGIGFGSSDSPSLAVLGSRLFAAWKGVPSDTRMFWSVFEP